jgi:hypothetical protein
MPYRGTILNFALIIALMGGGVAGAMSSLVIEYVLLYLLASEYVFTVKLELAFIHYYPFAYYISGYMT